VVQRQEFCAGDPAAQVGKKEDLDVEFAPAGTIFELVYRCPIPCHGDPIGLPVMSNNYHKSA
jgi:hypothetical protein